MDFSFISDEGFRAALVSDYREMSDCLESKAFKAVLVLSGSIVEALLVEYLSVSGARPAGKDPLTLQLNELIQACLQAGVLQKSTASLCDVIRDYRNLIHAGRIVRLNQEVTPEGAHIAFSLVGLSTKEISQKRKVTYGFTADQLLKKIVSDEHCLSVLPQLLTETNEHEKLKLVRSTLPEAYHRDEADPFNADDRLDRMRIAFRQIFETLSDIQKVEVAEKFAQLIRHDSAERIKSYGDAFFEAKDIAHLRSQDASLVTKYLQSKFDQPLLEISDGVIRTTAGLGVFLELEEIGKFVDTIVRQTLRQPDKTYKKMVRFASEAFNAVEKNKQQLFEDRGEKWAKIGRERKYPDSAQERLDQLELSWLDIPF